MPDGCISPQQFAQFLLEELPEYDQPIRDVRPTDGLIGHVSIGQIPIGSPPQRTKDRFRSVSPNVTKKWNQVLNDSCLGGTQAPCDPPENFIGMGSDRVIYGEETQSWRTQTFCLDQVTSVNKAMEHLAQWTGEVLKPATSRIASFWLFKRLAENAKQKWLANAAMAPFTYTWEATGDQEIFINTSGEPASKLTPQMLMRRVERLRNNGYFGKWTNDPFFGGYDRLIELITDDNTCWELDKAALDMRVSDAWRFQQWDAAHEYYRYGMGGQIGNFMAHIYPFPLRFNRVSANRFQVVLPYTNIAGTVGIGDEVNEDFLNAQWQFSLIHHRMSMAVNVRKLAQINPLMPFAVRDLGGTWNWANNDLGRDCDGNPIANYRGNKGFLYADFRYQLEPLHTEWEELIFHQREPQFVVEMPVCAADPGYPTQDYNSANDGCGYPDQGFNTIIFTPVQDSGGHYVLAANSSTCDGSTVTHIAIDVTDIAALVTALNAGGLNTLGTWVQEGVNVLLTESYCSDVLLPWVV